MQTKDQLGCFKEYCEEFQLKKKAHYTIAQSNGGTTMKSAKTI